MCTLSLWPYARLSCVVFSVFSTVKLYLVNSISIGHFEYTTPTQWTVRMPVPLPLAGSIWTNVLYSSSFAFLTLNVTGSTKCASVAFGRRSSLASPSDRPRSTMSTMSTRSTRWVSAYYIAKRSAFALSYTLSLSFAIRIRWGGNSKNL